MNLAQIGLAILCIYGNGLIVPERLSDERRGCEIDTKDYSPPRKVDRTHARQSDMIRVWM